MVYNYKGRDESSFDLIDTSELKYASSQLKKDCYKIIWAKGDSHALGIDGYRVFLKKNHLLFATPLNSLSINPRHKKKRKAPSNNRACALHKQQSQRAR